MKTKTIKIGKPSGSARLVENSEMKVDEVMISYGGGMGGGNQTFYGILLKQKEGEKTQHLTTVSGRGIDLNPRWIVKREKVTLVYVKHDEIEWIRNPNTRSEGVKRYCHEYFVVRADEDYKIYDTCFSGEDPLRALRYRTDD